MLGQIRNWFYFRYPWITRGQESIPMPVPAKPQVGYGYYPRVKFRAHIRTSRVGYPQIPVPAGKIVIHTFGLLKKRYNVLAIPGRLTLSALSGWSCVLVSSCTTWSSMMRETTTTMITITLSLPLLLHLSTMRYQLVSQAFFKGRHIWPLDWCFWIWNKFH
jgi:hypothetical protein